MTESEGTDSVRQKIQIRLECAPHVNFAMQQNAVPLLHKIEVENTTAAELEDVQLKIWSEPPVFAEKNIRVASIGPEATYRCDDTAVTLLREPLRRQREREEGQLWVTTTAGGLSERHGPWPVSILAYNEWRSHHALLEILAAHVMPNDRAVEVILAEAAAILRKETGDSAVSGYQSGDPKRAYAQAAAIYYAASRQGVAYCNPPASFEKEGQKIRTPDHILGNRLGTCLDTTNLLAACFEQAGLHAVVVMLEGHALPGVWLVKKSFDHPVTRHASILLNRVAVNELVVVESTGIAQSPPIGFKDAQKEAVFRLKTEGAFLYAIDIALSRETGIRPLSLSADTAEGKVSGAAAPGPEKPGEIEITPPDWADDDGPRSAETTVVTNDGPVDRLARWKMSLLDLTMRNRLLNYKESKKAVPILCPDIAGLEDALANNEAFRVWPRPDAWGEADPRNPKLQDEHSKSGDLEAFLRTEMVQHRLHAQLSEKELNARLTGIERAARLGMEEGGANTLFLALGFLVWTERGDSSVQRRSPILLLPMNISRSSLQDGFRIRRVDEESRVNITLLKKLQADFGIAINGLDPLPEDASGLDVPKILRIIRKAIMRMPGWQVVEESSLSILTFSRFLMWLDLEEHADLLKECDIVRHLVDTPNEVFDPDAAFPDMDSLDDRYAPSETFCPLPADSSQLRAVHAAAEGRTFVLQGPPGTGKSQTITNLIAHCLVAGKRVLFVAQKRAALDVVHKRVTDIGLGPFCLELHSNKTTKESFRRQIREILKIAAGKPQGFWEAQTARLADLRASLNSYVKDLHAPKAFGKTPYWAISRLIGHEGLPKVQLDLQAADKNSGEDYEALLGTVREVSAAVSASGNPAGHPLDGVRLASWTYGIEEDVAKIADDTTEALESLDENKSALLKAIGCDIEVLSFGDLETFKNLSAFLPPRHQPTRELLEVPDWPAINAELKNWVSRGRKCIETRKGLLSKYSEGVLSLDHKGVIEKLHSLDDVWVFKRWILTGAVKKEIQRVRIDGKKPKDISVVEKDILAAQEVVAETAALDVQKEALGAAFGVQWKGADSDWDSLDATVDWAAGYREHLDKLRGETPEQGLELRKKWVLAAAGSGPPPPTGGNFEQLLRAFTDALDRFVANLGRLQALLEMDAEKVWGGKNTARFLSGTESRLKRILENLPRLRLWTNYQTMRKKAVECGLSGLVEGLERGQVNADQLEAVFENALADWWARTVLPAIPSLAGFIGENHNLKIREFRAAEEDIAALSRTECFSRIAQRLPRVSGDSDRRAPGSSEVGTLQRFAKGGRKTIRRIFRDCPNALATLKPCVLMSPLSVAQFIGADFPKFDVVVFDEASQMPTYEAVGTIARGNQLIVVGDSRQLPPTSFFERQKGDEDFSEDDLPEELESILGEAEAAGIRTLRLNWHYRSRHESLITFSNRKYYDNRLNTFPSPATGHPRFGVRWREIPDGVYDHGKSRTNRKEAQAVVDEIVSRLRDPLTQNETLGVVTFSVAQQRLVEDMIDEARGRYPEIEPFFSDVEEPVFIKNLETVQGDERDIILFSICYGPDAAGIIRMNFGPLNNKGGERRLNVAVTRARKQLLVFSTLCPEQIDLSRTSAVGVRHLKTFLDYAKRGHTAFVEEISVDGGEVESPFEQSVCDALVARGWEVDKQVGCSGYRIDLAVKDDRIPGRYLLGVECDGAHYHSAKTARDRDRIRQMVLENLGWRLHRIWSTDWWLQRPQEIEKLEQAIEKAKLTVDGTEEKVSAPSPAGAAPDADIAFGDAPVETVTETKRVAGITAHRPSPPPAAPPAAPSRSGVLYASYLGAEISPEGDMHDPQNEAVVRKIVAEIVGVEAPILFDRLCRKVAEQWGLQRTGSRIRDTVGKAVQLEGLPVRNANKRRFVWTEQLLKSNYQIFRIPNGKEAAQRNAEEICPEEAANAALHALRQHISVDATDLAKETALLFEIRRLGPKVRVYIEEGIDLLLREGRCRKDGSMIVIT